VIRWVSRLWAPSEPLPDEEEFFQELFENAGDMIYTTDLAGVITSLNRAGERLTGYTRKDIIGQPIGQVLLGEVPAADRTTSETPVTRELEIAARDGRRIPVEVRTRLIRRSGRPAGVHGIVRATRSRAWVDQGLHDLHLRTDLMGRLVSLSDSLNQPTSVSSVAAAIGKGALTLSGAEQAALYLRAVDGTVTCLWSKGVSAAYVAHVVTPSGTPPWTHLPRRAELTCMDLPKRAGDQSPGPTLIPDFRDLPSGNDTRRLASQEGYRALAAWPLTHEGHTIAAIACYYAAPHTWSRPETEVMQTFAGQAATALENAHLYEAQGQRTAELEALYELSRRLRITATPEEMYPLIAERAVQLLRSDYGAIALLEPDVQMFTRVHATGVEIETLGATFPAADSLSGQVVQTGTPYVAEDIAVELASSRGQLSPEGSRSLGPLAIVALQSEREVIGTMTVGRGREEEARPFTEAEIRLLKGIAEIAGTAIRRSRLHLNLEQSYLQMVLALARAMDARDAYTGGHSERLADWAEAVARGLGCRREDIQDIRWAALLHDIGKIGISDGILRKPGKLTDEEWVSMRQHPVIGEQILLAVERMHRVAKIVRHHHERWDGSGYPDQLREQAIPLGCRILAVVDAYSAITDERPYKKAQSHSEAVTELRRCAGTQFDPRIVDAFCEAVDRSSMTHA
jgi:PAS domain S-box-containing protein/putative nucleotidyltransferase with HDIG domain